MGIFKKKKTVALVIVIGIMMVIITLAIAAANIMLQNAYINEGTIARMRAYYAAKAALIRAWYQKCAGVAIDASHSVGNGIPGYPSGGYQVTVNTQTVPAGQPLAGFTRIQASVTY